jgi:hypothetical protein
LSQQFFRSVRWFDLFARAARFGVSIDVPRHEKPPQ